MSVTTIEWTKRPGTIGETWNPTTGCNKVDRGCKNCYAEIMHKRLRAMGQPKYAEPFLDGAKVQYDTLDIPLRWKRPRTVFVNSMSDLFHKDVSFTFITEVFKVIERTPQHTYLVLTKRPEIAREYWSYRRNPLALGSANWKPPANLWIGTSVHDQGSADKRIPELLALDNCLRFLSYEPAIGPLNLYRVYFGGLFLQVLEGSRKLDWVIMGGESGPKAEPMDPAWAERVRDDCRRAGVPFFFKQWGLWHPVTLPTDGHYTGTHVKSRDKGFNLLAGETFQQFPA